VAAVCFGWVAVQSWRKPRPSGDARTRAGRGAKAALGGAAVYVAVAVVAAVVGVVVTAFR
jgi:hypothetical protein